VYRSIILNQAVQSNKVYASLLTTLTEQSIWCPDNECLVNWCKDSQRCTVLRERKCGWLKVGCDIVSITATIVVVLILASATYLVQLI